MNELLGSALENFQQHFGRPPDAAAYAPGRVEMLGNHCDYNGGYVMAAAIDRGTIVTGTIEDSEAISLLALDFNRTAHFVSSSFVKETNNTWANYILGVVDQLHRAGVPVEGFKAVVTSTIPMGAGLSSSAAMEVATALLLKQLYPYEMDLMDVAKLCQRAENQFVGVNSGLLDQFSSAFGAPDNLLFLDCFTFEHEQLPLPRPGLCLVVCDSMASHSLVGGDYNTRRAECMEAAAHFGKDLLRHVSLEEFNARKDELPENQRKRAQHVLDECQRCLEARRALKEGNAERFGQLMYESHRSSRYLFENSTPELDFLVDTASTLPGCLGSRLTGGGWGGATVNLVEKSHADRFIEALSSAYKNYCGQIPTVFVSAISNGAHEIEL
jgi:galactokinase